MQMEQCSTTILSEHQESIKHKDATEFLNNIKNQHTIEGTMDKRVKKKKTIGRT